MVQTAGVLRERLPQPLYRTATQQAQQEQNKDGCQGSNTYCRDA